MIEKLERSRARGHAADEKRRRAIVDAAIDGEAKAKAEFAAASRKIATMFDSARDAAKNDYNQAKTEAAAALRLGQKKAAKEHAEKTKPIDDSARLADAYRERLAVPRRRLPQVQAQSRSPRSRRASRTTGSAIPSDELFTRLARMEPPLKLLEGLIIPKAMKGGAKPGSSSS